MDEQRALARFWARVPNRGDGCWEWTGYLNPEANGITGRGFFHLDGRTVVAPRAAWILTNGPI